MEKRTKQLILGLRWLLIIPATYFLTLLASANPMSVERVYSGAIYKFVSSTIPFQYIPFVSFFEIFMLLAPIVLLVCFIIFIVRLVRNRQNRLWRVLEAVRKILILCGAVYFLFYFCWGLNYYRLPYSEIAGLPLAPSSTSELRELCTSLIGRTNEARALLPSAEDSTLDLPLSAADLQSRMRVAYSKADEDAIHGIRALIASPKPLLCSRFFSYMGITGIYIPFTSESNYNDDIPMPLKGATVCHELAHRQGFAREDEANFIAYLVCINATDGYLNYSGLLLATIHSMNKLYERDRESFNELYTLYSYEVAADLNAERIYWRAHSGYIEEAATRINDSYLKSNNLTDGVESYGRMVDLLLALQRQENQ